MDILGIFLKGTRLHKFLFVPIDYFAKLVDIITVALTTEKEIETSIQKNIITTFGVPIAMVFDNGGDSGGN